MRIALERTRARRRPPRRHRRDRHAPRRHGVQGDRPDLRAGAARRRRRAAIALEGGRIAVDDGAPHLDARRLGRRRLRRRRRGPDRRRGAGRQARRARVRSTARFRSTADDATEEQTAMADLRTEFLGIKSPNPFWLASAPPTDKEYNVVRAFKAAGAASSGRRSARTRRSSTSTARATARSTGRTGGCSASTTSS